MSDPKDTPAAQREAEDVYRRLRMQTGPNWVGGSGPSRADVVVVLDFISSLRADLLAAQQARDEARQLIQDVLDEEPALTREGCDACEDCGKLVMCRYHSLLSALKRNTWTNGALERDALKRQLDAVRAALTSVKHERDEALAKIRETPPDQPQGRFGEHES